MHCKPHHSPALNRNGQEFPGVSDPLSNVARACAEGPSDDTVPSAWWAKQQFSW